MNNKIEKLKREICQKGNLNEFESIIENLISEKYKSQSNEKGYYSSGICDWLYYNKCTGSTGFNDLSIGRNTTGETVVNRTVSSRFSIIS